MSKKVASSSVSRGVISGEISGLEASEKADEGPPPKSLEREMALEIRERNSKDKENVNRVRRLNEHVTDLSPEVERLAFEAGRI